MSDFRTRRASSGPYRDQQIMGLAGADVSTIYIAGQTGNDASSGTQNAPVKTMAEVGRMLKDGVSYGQDVSVVFLEQSDDPEGYPCDEMCRPRFVAGALRWRSDLYEAVSGVLTLTGRTNRTYTLSGAAAWTPGEWVGYALRLVSSSVPGMVVGDQKDISYNAAGSVTLAYQHQAYPSFANPAIGDTFEIVKPSLEIRVAPFADGTTPYFYGGVANALNVNTSRPRSGIVQMRNLSLRVPDGAGAFDFYAGGGFDFVGTEVCSDGITRPFWIFEVGSMTAGQWINAAYNPGEYVYGWGLRARPRIAGGPQCSVWMGKMLSEVYLTVGQLILSEGSWMQFQGGGLSADVIRCMLVEGGAQFYPPVGGGVDSLICRTAAATHRDFWVQSSGSCYIEDFTHVGVGSVFMSELGGYLSLYGGDIDMIGSTPLAASGNEARARRGGKVELLGGTYANLGDVSVGSTPASLNVRPSAAWAVGDRLAPSVPTLGEVVARVSL